MAGYNINNQGSDEDTKKTTNGLDADSMSGRVSVELLETHDVELEYANCVTMMRSTGEVLVHGVGSKEERSQKYALHAYRRKEGTLTYRTIPAACQDDAVEILPVTVQDGEQGEQEVLAVACPGCRNIKLLDVHNGKCTTAFSSKHYKPDLMCRGENGTMLVYSLRDPYPVLELNRANSVLTGPRGSLHTGMDQWCTGMCYLPAPQNAIVLSIASKSIIHAMSVGRNKFIWKINGEIDGVKCNPWALVYSAKHDAVLVCDGDNRRLLVLDPRDGAHLQTISLPRELTAAYDMCVNNHQMVLLHQTQLSFLSIN